MKKLLFLLLVSLASAASASASSEKWKDEDKTKASKEKEKEKDGDKMYEEESKKGIVDLYKWYLQNESRINNNDILKMTGNELAFPFKVDAKTLQQYFQFVKNNFPGLSEDDLSDDASTVKKQPVANRKKYAPVSRRDDMESQMTLPVNK